MTAAISSRSSVFTEAVGSEEAAPASRAAPLPQPHADRVEPFKGQAPRGAPSTDAVLAQVDQKMKLGVWGGVRDWFVTEQASRESVDLLGQLGAADYRKAIWAMKPDTMKALLGNMDADTRATFFRQAQQKGVVVEEPAVAAPRTAGAPPDKPALMRNEPHLPSALRQAIHTENQARTDQYTRDFGAYVSRYATAALEAKSPLALRQLGPPAREFVLAEGGVLSNDRTITEPLHQGATQRAPAARAVSDRIADFTGRPRAGSITLNAEAKVALEAGGFGVESVGKLDVTDYGKVTAKSKNEGAVKMVPGVAIGVDADGHAFTELGGKPLKARFENGKLTELEGKAGAIGFSMTEDKTTLSTKVPGAPIGGYATIDEKHGRFGGGLKAGGDADILGVKVEATLKLGVTMQGVAPERYPAIASMVDDGLWGPMPELNGTKWDAIPEARRKRLALDGWTRGNWPVR